MISEFTATVKECMLLENLSCSAFPYYHMGLDTTFMSIVNSVYLLFASFLIIIHCILLLKPFMKNEKYFAIMIN